MKRRNVPDYSIFIGDLPPGVTDEMLFDLFAAKYQSVRTARIVTDKDTGQSKGFFLRMYCFCFVLWDVV
jgi:RNA recognition motif-containing protein